MDISLRASLQAAYRLCSGVTLADIYHRRIEFFDQGECAWALNYPFFTTEPAIADPDPLAAPQAIVVVMMALEAIRTGTNIWLLDGRNYRTGSMISRHAVVTVALSGKQKICLDSWPKNHRHPLLADWHEPLSASH